MFPASLESTHTAVFKLSCFPEIYYMIRNIICIVIQQTAGVDFGYSQKSQPCGTDISVSFRTVIGTFRSLMWTLNSKN